MTVTAPLSYAQWGARLDRWRWAGKPKPIPMTLPVSKLYVHHSVTRATSDPAADMRAVENIGISRFGRFSYSYAVHPDGTTMTGCGDWVGAHTAGLNSTSLAVVVIGNYETDRPTPQAKSAVAGLARWLVETGRLRAGTYPTGGHRDAPGASTACPGRHLYTAIPEIRALAQEDDFDMTRDELKEAVKEVLLDVLRAPEFQASQVKDTVKNVAAKTGASSPIK